MRRCTKTVGSVLSLVPYFVSAAPACPFFGSRYQTRGQEICVDSLQNHLNLPTDGQSGARVREFLSSGRPCSSVRPRDNPPEDVPRKSMEMSLLLT